MRMQYSAGVSRYLEIQRAEEHQEISDLATTAPAETTIEQRHSSVRQLIEIGREKGYLLYDEVHDHLPDDIVTAAEELEEVFLRLGELGIGVIHRP